MDPGGTTTGGGGRDRCVVVKAEAWECRRARDGVGPEARWGGMGSGQPWGGAGVIGERDDDWRRRCD